MHRALLKPAAPFAVLLALGMISLLVMMASAPAVSQDGSYVVEDIAVEESGDTISAARDRAFDVGQRRAFERLMQQLDVGQDVVDPSAVSMDAIGSMLAGFQVGNERTAPGRYLADLTFRFDPDAVRSFLRGRQVTFTEVETEEILVLPVYVSDGGPRLWDDPNPWMDVWLDYEPESDRSSVVAPFGDIEDVSAVSVDAAMQGDRSALDRIASRYDAAGTVVAVVEPSSDGLTLVLNRFTDGPDSVQVIEVEGDPEIEETYREAAREVAIFIRDNWPAETEVESGPLNEILVRVPLSSASDWYEVQRRLNQVRNLDDLRIERMSPREVIVRLQYFGDSDQLAQAAAQQRLSIERQQTQDGTLGTAVGVLRVEGGL